MKRTMLEFFAGSGLVSYGLRRYFTPLWANDISPQKAKVYYENFGRKIFQLEDIKNINGIDLPCADLSWASFPCQDLSLAGNLNGINASRSGLVWEWFRILDEMKVAPKVLCLENVVGLISAKNGAYYKQLHNALVERGYRCGAIVLNASQFVPQSRPRVFVIAVSNEIDIPMDMVSDGPDWLHKGIPRIFGTELKQWIWWNSGRPKPCKKTIEDIIDLSVKFDKDYVVSLIPESHIKKISSSVNYFATGYRRTRNGKQQLEIRTDGVAGCLRTPGGGSSKQYLIAKIDNNIHARYLTTREVARLMGAPDSFKLPGTDNDGYKAMGDAVVAPVAEFIGKKFLSRLVDVSK